MIVTERLTLHYVYNCTQRQNKKIVASVQQPDGPYLILITSAVVDLLDHTTSVN